MEALAHTDATMAVAVLTFTTSIDVSVSRGVTSRAERRPEGRAMEPCSQRMTRRSYLHRCAVVAALAISIGATTSTQRAPDTFPRDGFAVVNGQRLHYVDWGGSGETVLFLTALGGDVVRQFDALAPQFTDRFHVLGLTRRGQGQSDKPTSGYDTDTLARDLLGFLDLMRIQRVNLVGHSVAGAEMTRFAETFPDRVARLVYLDAANDYRRLGEIAADARLAPPRDRALAAILEGAGESSPDYSKVDAPALDIVVVYETTMPVGPDDDETYRRYVQLVYERDFVGEQIGRFRRDMKRGTILELRDTDHVAFLHDRRQLDVVIPAMRRFLQNP